MKLWYLGLILLISAIVIFKDQFQKTQVISPSAVMKNSLQAGFIDYVKAEIDTTSPKNPQNKNARLTSPLGQEIRDPMPLHSAQYVSKDDDPNNSLAVSRILDSTALPMFEHHVFDTIHYTEQERILSRCPTYVGFELAEGIQKGSKRVGNIVWHRGCPKIQLAKFELDLTTGIVLLQRFDSKEYVGWREYEFRRWGKAS